MDSLTDSNFYLYRKYVKIPTVVCNVHKLRWWNIVIFSIYKAKIRRLSRRWSGGKDQRFPIFWSRLQCSKRKISSKICWRLTSEINIERKEKEKHCVACWKNIPFANVHHSKNRWAKRYGKKPRSSGFVTEFCQKHQNRFADVWSQLAGFK